METRKGKDFFLKEKSPQPTCSPKGFQEATSSSTFDFSLTQAEQEII